jgi:L-fuculose-phosphate aldolase
MMFNDRNERELICEVGRRLYNRGFAAANDGNISIRIAEDRFLCTPTGVSKGFMKPEDLCIVDSNGDQVAGVKKRTSEIKVHLSVYKARKDIMGVVHCHPPHATAFAIAREPIPKCVLPEVEVFLGEVPIADYETPGTQQFADSILPFVHDSTVVMLANHGSLAFAKDLMTAYFNTEIIDAYCKMLILARQLGPITHLKEKDTRELLEFKKRLGIDDPRLHMEDCDLCGNSLFREGYSDYAPRHRAFPPAPAPNSCSGLSSRNDRPANGKASKNGEGDLDLLVATITNQVMAALGK